ncbi:flagellar filament capping protein FliD, partial [Pseudoalteromonas sp. SG41-6]
DNGFVAKFDDVIKGYTASGGIIETRIDGREAQIDKLTDESVSFNLRMADYEKRLLNQYNAMDLLVGNLKNTGNYLTAQLANLPGVVKKS